MMRETIAIYCDNRTENINALCVNARDTYV
jgi:hypothetical protein